MKVLVIGSGGREHTICKKLKADGLEEIYCAPGNGGTSLVATNVDIKSDNIEELVSFARTNKIDMTIVGPELPLVIGIVDRFEEEGLKVFGPNKSSARLEASKDFSKMFMEKYGIDTARYRSFTNYEDAIKGIEEFSYPLVIKADGLCLGKGVIICKNLEEADKTLKNILEDKVFGDEGSKVVVEEFLDGIEASLLCLVSKNKIVPLEAAKDYKKIFDGDQGPNTGGVGCYSPSPLFTKDFNDQVEGILRNIELGFEGEGLNFTGVLFIGFMIVNGQAKVLEFNTRFGDPETQVVLPRLKSNLYEVLDRTITGDLEEDDLIWDLRKSLTVILTSRGYPESYGKGYLIEGLDNVDEDIIVVHNGTERRDGGFYTSGGRVLSIISLGNDFESIRQLIYKNIEKISYEGKQYRKDIGII